MVRPVRRATLWRQTAQGQTTHGSLLYFSICEGGAHERGGEAATVVTGSAARASAAHEEAAVVWGREELLIREDHVVLEHRFYDQDGELVKALETLAIEEMGGRTIASRQRMAKADTPEEWTEIAVNAVEYEIDIRDSVFTLSNLRNPRD